MNHLLTQSVNNIPYNWWQKAFDSTGTHLASLHFLRMIGCAAYVHQQEEYLLKMDLMETEMVLVGYETGSKAYCIWNPKSKKIVTSSDLTFLTSVFLLKNQDNHTFCKDVEEKEWWFTLMNYVREDDKFGKPHLSPTSQLSSAFSNQYHLHDSPIPSPMLKTLKVQSSRVGLAYQTTCILWKPEFVCGCYSQKTWCG